MQGVTIFVLLAMVAMASAEFWCCPGERTRESKKVKKAPGAVSMEPASDFPAYSPAGKKAIFSKPVSSNAMPTVHPTGETVNLAARNEITPVETTDKYRGPSDYIPKPGPTLSVPMSPPRITAVERNAGSPIRDTENIPTPGSNSVPIETRSRSPVPTAPMRSHISNPQVNERNDKATENVLIRQVLPMPPKLPSYKEPSAGLNVNNGLSKGSSIPMPPPPPPNFSKAGTSATKKSWPTVSNSVTKGPSMSSYQKPSAGLNNNNGLSNGSSIPMPPPPPNFSKAIKKNGPTVSHPVKAPPAAPAMSSYQGPSIGQSKATLAAVRGGLRPVQTSDSNRKPTQSYGRPDATESKWPSNPSNPIPQINQRSCKPSHRTPEAKQTSQDTKHERAAVMNLARRFDNPQKTPASSNPMVSEFAMISQRRNRINNVNWDQFDKTARKL